MLIHIYLDQCSHLRSVQYFAESVNSPSGFSGIKCDSWRSFQKNICSGHHVYSLNYLGFNANTQILGDFYFSTNSKANFSRGLDGIFNYYSSESVRSTWEFVCKWTFLGVTWPPKSATQFYVFFFYNFFSNFIVT